MKTALCCLVPAWATPLPSAIDSLADSVMSVTLDATNGEMTLAQLTGVTVVSGADSSDYMVLEGLESDLNAALDGLVFVPDENFNGAADISVTTSISSQLIGNYSFDAGTAANDSAYAGNDGTLVADATTTSDAEHGTVLTLDGAGDHVLVDGLFDQPDHVTLSAWVNLSAIDTGGAQVISLGDNVALSVDTLGFNYGVSGPHLQWQRLEYPWIRNLYRSERLAPCGL